MERNTLVPFDLPQELFEYLGEDGEKGRIIEAMVEENGHVTNATKLLNISRAAMYQKIKQYGWSADD